MWHNVLGLLYSPVVILQLMSTYSNDISSEHLNEKSNTSASEICGTNGKASLLYYPKLNGCYHANVTGPCCSENMILYASEENEKIGECDCDRTSLRTLIFHRKTQNCYPIFKQGYCTEGKWLDLTKDGIPTCRRNPCYKEGTTANSHEGRKDIVQMDGKCVRVGSSSVCKPGEVVGFNEKRRLPICSPRPFMGIRSIGAVPVKCRPGTYRAMTGRCQPKFEFEWD